MPDSISHKLYEAYVCNVRDFQIAEKELRRTINKALKENKQTSVKIQTKLYALLYSTYSESSFMKMILTPYGFEQKFIDEILNQENIQEKWFKVLEIAFLKFSAHSKNSEIPNKKLELRRIITKYIISSSVLRNRIAHGQITVALNKKNTDLNLEITEKIENLDFVDIYRHFVINKKLVELIEDLIESPNKAHYNYYHSKFQNLELFISKSENWSTESKMKTHSMLKVIPRK